MGRVSSQIPRDFETPQQNCGICRLLWYVQSPRISRAFHPQLGYERPIPRTGIRAAAPDWGLCSWIRLSFVRLRCFQLLFPQDFQKVWLVLSGRNQVFRVLSWGGWRTSTCLQCEAAPWGGCFGGQRIEIENCLYFLNVAKNNKTILIWVCLWKKTALYHMVHVTSLLNEPILYPSIIFLPGINAIWTEQFRHYTQHKGS